MRQVVFRGLTVADRFAARIRRPFAKPLPRPTPEVDTGDWVAKTKIEGVLLEYVQPSEVVENDLPRNVVGHIDHEYTLAARVEIPSAYVLTIPHGRVVGEHGAVVTPDHKLLLDVSWPVGTLRSCVLEDHDDVPDGEEFFTDAALPVRNVAGTVAVLSAFYGRTYFHWMWDVLPRLKLLEDAGINLDDVDAFVVPGYFSGFQIESLSALGIGRNRVLSSLKHRNIEAERLLVPSLPRRSGVVPKWAIDYLRNAFPPLEPAGGMHASRIYVTRKVTDHGLLDGEQKLVEELMRYGFQPLAMEDFTLREKAWLLGRAEAIVGPSGAGLANVLFCRPGTKVVELRVQPVPVMEAWDISNRCELEFFDVLPAGYGDPGQAPLTDKWGMVARGSVHEADILRTLEFAGLIDQQARQ